MSSPTFQLQTILHSYETRSPLVYRKSDDCFYSVISPSKLSQKDYVVSAKEVNEKINQFIVDNGLLLDAKILLAFKSHLEGRVSDLKLRTQGLLGIITSIFFLFNPQAKLKLQQQRNSLDNLNQTIQKTLTSKQEEELNEENLSETEDKTQRETPKKQTPSIKQQQASSKKHSPVRGSEIQQKNLPENRSTDAPPAEQSSDKPPIRSSLLASIAGGSSHLLKRKSKPEQQKTVSPIRNIIKKIAIERPSTGIPTSLDKLIEAEPSAPELSEPDYKLLRSNELDNRIKVIENYIKKTKLALIPVEKKIADCLGEKEQIKENNASLAEIKEQLKQAEANLKLLQDGMKTQTTTYLHFKTSKTYTKIPFYPKKLQTEIFEKQPDLRKDLFFPFLELESAVQFYEVIYVKLQKKSEWYEAEIKSCESKLLQIEESCQTTYQKKLEALQEAMQAKTKNLDDWNKYKKACERNLKPQHNKVLEKFKKSKGLEPSRELIDKFPELDLLTKLPQEVPRMLKSLEVGSQNITVNIDEFPSKIYGMLFDKPKALQS